MPTKWPCEYFLPWDAKKKIYHVQASLNRCALLKTTTRLWKIKVACPWSSGEKGTRTRLKIISNLAPNREETTMNLEGWPFSIYLPRNSDMQINTREKVWKEDQKASMETRENTGARLFPTSTSQVLLGLFMCHSCYVSNTFREHHSCKYCGHHKTSNKIWPGSLWFGQCWTPRVVSYSRLDLVVFAEPWWTGTWIYLKKNSKLIIMSIYVTIRNICYIKSPNKSSIFTSRQM